MAITPLRLPISRYFIDYYYAAASPYWAALILAAADGAAALRHHFAADIFAVIDAIFDADIITHYFHCQSFQMLIFSSLSLRWCYMPLSFIDAVITPFYFHYCFHIIDTLPLLLHYDYFRRDTRFSLRSISYGAIDDFFIDICWDYCHAPLRHAAITPYAAYFDADFHATLLMLMLHAAYCRHYWYITPITPMPPPRHVYCHYATLPIRFRHYAFSSFAFADCFPRLRFLLYFAD